jgi:hypothetical protein
MNLINYLTPVHFDFGAVRLLANELAAVGVRAPLIVTDHGIVEAGLLERVTVGLPHEPAATFVETPPNPTEAAVEAALKTYIEARCDGIIAVGGGSSIDLAKAVALMATHPGPLEGYAAILGGVAKITPAVAPVFAVPTTAGTGSEVGRAALITLRDGRKLGFLSPHLIPRRAFCDPELTIGLPSRLTAATGMDALTHCVETFLSPRINPPADAIALDGFQRAWRWIERATLDGRNRDARWNMMMASLEGGLTFQKGLGAVHAMSHPLGGLSHPVCHHGTLNAVLLPAVLRFNAGHVGDKYDRLMAAAGLPSSADLAGEIEQLNDRLGLPAGLRDMGVPEEVLPKMAAGAVADHSSTTNPRPATEADYAALLRSAMT